MVACGGSRSRRRCARVLCDARAKARHRGGSRDAALSLQVRHHDCSCGKRVPRMRICSHARASAGAKRRLTFWSRRPFFWHRSPWSSSFCRREAWSASLIGDNSITCLTSIPLIGIAPLAIFLLVLRHGAPTRPGLAGAVAGLLAGGIAATLYAAKCTDDSPLFVATWYTIAIAGLALAALDSRAAWRAGRRRRPNVSSVR